MVAQAKKKRRPGESMGENQTNDKSCWIYVKHDKKLQVPNERYCLDNNSFSLH